MHYYPILKAKQGELQALTKLAASTKSAVRPVLQIPPPSMSRPDRGEEAVLVPHDERSLKICLQRLKNVADLECFLDPGPAQLSIPLIHSVVRNLAALSKAPAPVLELQGSDDYLAAYRIAIGEPETYCLRLPNEACVDAAIVTTIQRALHHYGLTPENGVLLLDMADVSLPAANIVVYGNNAVAMFRRTARMSFLDQVLASGAFPASFPPPAASWSMLPFARRDYEMWGNVNAQISVSYGDYAVSNPNNSPMPSYSGSPKARYTHDVNFYVIKGVAVGPHPNTMSTQYHRISRLLSATPIYAGPTFSWGDGHIDGCCNPASTSNGNLTTWVAVNTNHHIEFVINSLLPAAPPAPVLATPSAP